MSFRYLLVDVDGIASFGVQANPDASTQWLSNLVGPEGRDRVRVHPDWPVSGWVNDCGLLMPDRYPRNVVGGVLLGTLGGPQQPYAGPVVITEWDPTATSRGEPEIRTLHDSQVELLTHLVSDIRKTLGVEPGMPTCTHAGWRRDVKLFAEFVATGEHQPIRVVSGAVAVAVLFGRPAGGVP